MMLWKVVEGVFTVLESIEPVVDLNQWFILRVERFCDGEISLFIDDDLKISVQDRSITDPGKIGLAAWAESTYFDDVTFEKVNSDTVVDIEEFICSGRFYEVDTNRYNESGLYIDTLTTALGCDSIVRLKLTIVPHYLVTERDTICGHEIYLFGADTLRSSGRYNQALQSMHGCDSLVELNLIVLGGDTTTTDTSMCQGSFIIFKNDSIFQAGSYFDTIFSDDGCFGITELRVSVGLPGLDLGEDQSVCFEGSPEIALRVTGVDCISWCDGRNQETIAISAPGTYWVEVYEGNCSATDTIQIDEECTPTTQIYIPNAFSPNADEVNDVFIPSIVPLPAAFRMTIFNRWGGLVHQSTNISYGWDGRVNGEIEPAGVYVYVIEVDGVLNTGTITLIR
ncbi:MAG: gliding motility-associated C-terminal domain-containing protein [Saprospiraceae bacterium]|nr:gliding motility-associated C-terminal domain-containing protein [Saprospiraceae bacterium]